MAVEVVVWVIVTALLVVVTAMAVIGLLGVTGSFYLGPCPNCRHLVSPVTDCPYCRHRRALRLLHIGHMPALGPAPAAPAAAGGGGRAGTSADPDSATAGPRSAR